MHIQTFFKHGRNLVQNYATGVGWFRDENDMFGEIRTERAATSRSFNWLRSTNSVLQDEQTDDIGRYLAIGGECPCIAHVAGPESGV